MNKVIGLMAVLGGSALLFGRAYEQDNVDASKKKTTSSGKSKKGSKKGSKKRAPSPYNKYVQKRMPELRSAGKTPSQAMKTIAKEWKVKKGK